MREVALDCRHYLGDRPCSFHKSGGAVCRCSLYEPVRDRTLIIKLDAMGDVLRTTCLLPGISEKWPGSALTWITRPESVALLGNNPYLAEVVPYGPEALIHLSVRSFDRVISLDAGSISAGLASMAEAPEKHGYVLAEKGHVEATNGAARTWLELGVFDDLKKENARTYQDHMCDILDLPRHDIRYVMRLTPEELEAGRSHLERLGVDPDGTVLGIHTGGGGRWQLKQWSEDSYLDLIGELLNDHGEEIRIVLFGGPLEAERNRRIKERFGERIFDAGHDNEVRHFAALVAGCSVILTSDSLAMHIALAMERRVVVLFGPTSHAEIDLFGLGEKMVPDLECLVCYRTSCDLRPNCMESITVSDVKERVLRQLALAG